MSKLMEAKSADHAPRFSLVVGGPFHALLSRLGLTGADQLPTLRAAFALALLAWLPPALLVVAQSVIDNSYSGWGFFTDLTVYTRYLIAVWVLVATERYADSRTIMLVHEFRDARLIPDDSHPAFAAALDIADRRSSSRLAELLILLVAVVWSALSTQYAVEIARSSWEGAVIAGGVSLSWAGEAGRFLSNPLFLFLVLRWFWRFLVWTVLLYRLSRLRLQLSPMHPDRSAGLGFLAIYPGIFSGLAFALSCVVASAMLKELSFVQHDPQAVWLALALWVAVVLLVFIGPLLVFTPHILAAREKALLEYGRLVNQFQRAFHHKWIDEARNGKDLMGATDLAPLSSLYAILQTVRGLQVIPVDKTAVAQLVIAAGLPLLAVVAKQVSLLAMLQWIVGKIL
ncbi:MAG: hypothetical protein Q8O37_01460 [Sulfuricellaceae bacterium]|nr:hypothetical protein [Sulfuricellaceae bacterium]